jgi:hypothetical protein
MPQHRWKLQAAVRSALPVARPGQSIRVALERQDLQIVLEPVAVHESHVWPGYSSVIPQRAWDYGLTVEGTDEVQIWR